MDISSSRSVDWDPPAVLGDRRVPGDSRTVSYFTYYYSITRACYFRWKWFMSRPISFYIKYSKWIFIKYFLILEKIKINVFQNLKKAFSMWIYRISYFLFLSFYTFSWKYIIFYIYLILSKTSSAPPMS
jgi:hypothetical protein